MYSCRMLWVSEISNSSFNMNFYKVFNLQISYFLSVFFMGKQVTKCSNISINHSFLVLLFCISASTKVNCVIPFKDMKINKKIKTKDKEMK